MNKPININLVRQLLTDHQNSCYSDEELEKIVKGAIEWIDGHRYSWAVVSANYIRHGEYRP